MAVRKRVTLHPVNKDGTPDLNTNLYPKTLISGIVDENGNPVQVAQESEIEDIGDSLEQISQELETKQDTLVSGVNIKTISSHNILGDGNLQLTKEDVGLDNVDNTSDLNKPISTATQNALDLKSNATYLENGSGTNSLQQKGCTASGINSFAEGSSTKALGTNSHVEGLGATGFGLPITGEANTTTYTTMMDVSGLVGLVLEFSQNNVTRYAKIIEIIDSRTFKTDRTLNPDSAITNKGVGLIFGVTYGGYSHAEGYRTNATGFSSHTEGQETFAIGECSHAEGIVTRAIGRYSHSEGASTIAGYDYQSVSGKFNDNKETTLLEIGNGTSDYARSNAFEVYLDGHAEVGLMGNTNKSITTKEYVDTTKQDKIVATSADVGKLVGVDSSGNLTLVNAPSSGTKLYKHQISLSGDVNSSLIIISNDSTWILNFGSLDLLVMYRIGGYVNYQGTVRTIIGMYYEQSTIMTARTITYLNVDGTVGTVKFTRSTIINDNVTAL